MPERLLALNWTSRRENPVRETVRIRVSVSLSSYCGKLACGDQDVIRHVLFHRRYQGWTGGHMVHAQYMRIISQLPGFEVALHLTPDSRGVDGSPWADFADRTLLEWSPEQADILFVAGMDWMALPRQSAIEARKPVLNLIQGLGHADSQSGLFQSLDRKAVRICVSEAVAEAVLKTRRCNGPVYTIRNALAPDVSRQQSVEKTVRVAIVAAKQPDLATQIADTLRPLGIDVDLIEACDRSTFLDRLARSRIAVFLPFEREGFYLPALEGMGLGCVVVCPDCVGNRSYCRAGVNSIVPEYSAADIVEATIAATRISSSARQSMLAAARDTADDHSERRIAERLVPLLNGML